MIRLLPLLCLVFACVAGEGTVLRVTWSGATPGLTAVVVKHNEEDHTAQGHRLGMAEVADGACAVPVTAACESYAMLVLRGEQVVWGRSHLDPGEDLGEVKLPAEDGTLEGSVAGPDGKALAGIRLRLWRKHDNSCSHWTLGHSLVADAEGGFAIEKLARGTWGIAIDDENWSPVRREVTVGGGTAVVELIAKAGAVVSGTVKDAQGNPVAGATIRYNQRSVQSAADGTWRLGGLDPGTVRLRASAPGLALADNAPVEVKVPAGGSATSDLVLQPTGRLRITIAMEDAAIALPATAWVELDHRGSGGHERREVPVAAGVAGVDELAPGSYQLRVGAAGSGTARLPVTIAAGTECAVEARLPRVHAYRGRLTWPEGIDATTIAISGGVEITEGRSTSWSSGERATVEADGTFRLAGLEAGVLRLSITAKGCIPQEHRIQVGPGGEAEGSFALSRGRTVRVTVRDPAGKPLPGAKVGIDAGRLDWDGETGEDGVAVLDGVADGAAELKVEHEEYVPHQAKLTVDATSAPEVTVQAGLSITGSIIGADGKPLAEARINAWGRSGGNHQSRSTTSAADGTFRLAGLGAGTWQVSASHEGETVAQLDAVAAGAQGLTLTAKAQVELVILVSGPDGAALPGIALTLDPERASNQELLTDARGRTMAKLRRGTKYRIYGKPESFRAVNWRGQVPDAGEVAAVELRLDPGRTLRGTLLGHDGAVVAGLSVQVQAHNGQDGGGEAKVQPDAAGAFTFTGLAPGPSLFQVIAGERNVILQRDLLIPVVGEPAPLALRLPALGAIVGTVPVADRKERTMVAAMNGLERVHLWVEVGADGAFRLDSVPVGVYSVVVSTWGGRRGGERQLSTTCTVRAGEDVTASFAPPAAVGTQRVAGLVERDAVDAPGQIRLMLIPDQPVTLGNMASFGNRHAEVGADGSFDFAAVPAGPHILVAMLQGQEGDEQGMWRSRIVVADRPLDLRLVPRGVSVPVRLLDPAGQPVEGATVMAIPDDGSFIQRWMGSGMGRTDATGAATVRWLEGPAMCSLMVQHRSLGQFLHPGVAARPGMAVVDVRCAERVVLRGKVAAPPGAVVHVVALMADGLVQDRATAAEDGTFVFSDTDRLHPGTWDVFAYAGGCSVAHRRLELSAESVLDFTLVPAGRIALRVTGGEAAGLEAEVRAADGGELIRPRMVWMKQQYPQVAIAPIEADGSCEIDGLAPGRYTVVVPGAVPVAVEVVAGQTAAAALTLP